MREKTPDQIPAESASRSCHRMGSLSTDHFLKHLGCHVTSNPHVFLPIFDLCFPHRGFALHSQHQLGTFHVQLYRIRSTNKRPQGLVIAVATKFGGWPLSGCGTSYYGDDNPIQCDT